MTAIGLALSEIIDGRDAFCWESLVEKLGDAGRLLADQLHRQTIARRSLILPKITDRTYREVLKGTTPDAFLFGHDLSDKLKASEAVATMSKALFQAPSSSSRQRSGNFRGQGKVFLRPALTQQGRDRPGQKYPTSDRSRQDWAGYSRWDAPPAAKRERR